MQGWEKLGLYEWSREKQAAIKKKHDDIASGVREKSATPEPTVIRDSSPEEEQRVPDTSRRVSAVEKKKYRSRSRTRSRSGSRTPPRRRRSRTRSRSRERRHRSRSRGRRDRSRSRSRERRRRSRTRSGSRESGSMPSHLTRRSPTPPSSSPWAPPPSSSSGGSLDGSNKGMQMLQKMGWKGAGLGAEETGIVEPIKGGEVRDKQDQYRGMGVSQDPFESFRKQRAGAF